MILVPRSAKQAANSVEILKKAGFCALPLEISTITFNEAATEALENASKNRQQEIIITSQNALPYVQNFSDFPVHIVGDKSARIAQKLGFGKIKSISPNASALLEKLSLQTSDLLYLRGADISLDITKKLRDKDVSIKEIIVYSAQSCLNLPAAIVSSLQAGEIKAVIFYSSRSAEFFIELLKKYNLLFSGISAICFSANIAQKIEKFSWKEIIISSQPNEEAVIFELEKLFLK